MKTLYLDTAYNQTLGICDERGEWLCRRHGSGQRSSAKMHVDLHEMCEELKIQAQGLKRIVYVAGPGFYTGLRVAYGVAQTLRLGGAATFSLYNHLVPGLLGVTRYTWITKAYRGEVFVYQQDGASGTSGLITEDKFLNETWQGALYIHHEAALDEKIARKLPAAQATEGLILDHFPKLLPRIVSGGEQPLYYFRAPEDEFKPGP